MYLIIIFCFFICMLGQYYVSDPFARSLHTVASNRRLLPCHRSKDERRRRLSFFFRALKIYEQNFPFACLRFLSLRAARKCTHCTNTAYKYIIHTHAQGVRFFFPFFFTLRAFFAFNTANECNQQNKNICCVRTRKQPGDTTLPNHCSM